MKKVEIIKQLDNWGVGFDPFIKWLELQKLYKYEKIQREGDVFGLQQPDPDPDPDLLRDRPVCSILEDNIIKLMKSLKGRHQASRGEIDKMFALYNSYFNRVDSPGCNSCVGRIFKRMNELSERLAERLGV